LSGCRACLSARGDELLEHGALPAIGFGGLRPVQPPVGPLIAEFCAGAVERAGDRRDAHVGYFGDFGGGRAVNMAQDQHRPLARWQ
jgi:hypothetical protein